MSVLQRFFFTALFMLLAVGAWAVPARPGQWQQIRLADGTTVRAELKGDEHCHYWQAQDGRLFVHDAAQQIYRQTVREELPYVLPMSFGQRHVTDSVMSPLRVLGRPHTEPVTGVMKGLVVLVQFSDVKFQSGHNKQLYDRILNEQGFSDSSLGFIGSVNDYFMAQSDGRFDYKFDVIGPVTLSDKATYYGGESGFDHMKEFVGEALELIKAEVNFATYDNDHDGYVDEVFFVFAGKGANDGGSNCIWPHMYWYKSAWGGYFKQNRKYVDTYACANELSSNGNLTGIGAICHEFAHCLDIPDMYDTVAGQNACGHYSLMDVGCYNGNMFIPAGFNAYEREFCGWRQIVELTDDATYDHIPSVSHGGVAYKMTNAAVPDEYFVIEPRSKSGWDAGLPADGLVIYHIDYTQPSDWTANVVNTTSKNSTGHYDIQIIKASNGTDYEQRYPFPYGLTTSFDDETDVSTALYYDNVEGFDKRLGKGIYDMARNADGTYSFRYQADPGVSAIGEIRDDSAAIALPYNLFGQRVTSSFRGLRIVAGRKIYR